ncbi:DNA-binding transcriptional regulator CynR [compost metagenome]
MRVGAIHGAICGLLVRALPPFAQMRPDVTIEIHEARLPRTASMILKQEIDLMLCREPEVRPEGWGFSELMPDRLVVVTGPKHPLLSRGAVGFSDLFDETWLLLHSSTSARHVFDKLMEHHGISPKYRSIEALSTPIAVAQLRSERIVMLAPFSVFRQLVEFGLLAVLDVVDIPPLQPVGVLSPKDGDLSETVLDFKNFLSRYAQQHP